MTQRCTDKEGSFYATQKNADCLDITPPLIFLHKRPNRLPF